MGGSRSRSRTADRQKDRGENRKHIRRVQKILECKWCGNTSESAQPLVRLQEKNPCLCWRRQGGLECSICPQVIDLEPDYKQMGKEALKDELQNEAQFEVFMQRRQSYIDSKNSHADGWVSRPGITSAPVEVRANRKAANGSRMCLGYLWPTKLWNEKHPEVTLPSTRSRFFVIYRY